MAPITVESVLIVFCKLSRVHFLRPIREVFAPHLLARCVLLLTETSHPLTIVVIPKARPIQCNHAINHDAETELQTLTLEMNPVVIFQVVITTVFKAICSQCFTKPTPTHLLDCLVPDSVNLL